MADHGSPHPPRRGPAAAALVLGVVLTSFAAWWFVTADNEEVDVTTPAASATAVSDSAVSDSAGPSR